jgi:probable rRNA maturation factor
MKLKLEVTNDQQALEISDALVDKLEQLLQLAGELEDVSAGDVALSLVDDETIHALNKEYRGIDSPTDVLSFSMLEASPDELEILYGDEDDDDDELDEERSDNENDSEDDQDDDEDEEEDDFPEPLGDIIISIPTAIAQSQEYGHSIEREIGFLFVHGFLHLLGYDHQDEAAEKQMFAKQEQVLLKAGLTR